MASVPLPGCKLRLMWERPTGQRDLIHSGITEIWGPGGSPDAAPATVKANELHHLPLSGVVGHGGDKLQLTYLMTAADGADKSDWFITIPYTMKDSSGRITQGRLAAADLGTATDLPAASTADVWHDYSEGYTVPQGAMIKLGGGPVFISAEDDA